MILIQQLRNLYKQQHELLETDWGIFFRDINDWEQEEEDNIQRFMNEITPIVNCSIKDCKLLGKGFRKITSYFPQVNKKRKHHVKTINDSSNDKNRKQVTEIHRTNILHKKKSTLWKQKNLLQNQICD